MIATLLLVVSLLGGLFTPPFTNTPPQAPIGSGPTPAPPVVPANPNGH